MVWIAAFALVGSSRMTLRVRLFSRVCSLTSLLLPLVLVALHVLDGCEDFNKVKWPEVPKVTIGTSSNGGGGGEWSHDLGDAGMLAPLIAPPCALPKHHDDYAGFTIGQPAGWLVESGTGTITVSKDQKGMVGALVYPARVRKTDIPADRFADLFASQLGRNIAQRGGSFQLSNRVTDGHIARADATATIDGVKLRGPLEVRSDPGFVTLKLYWAPEESFAAEEPTLKQVVACFHRETLITQKHPPPPSAISHHGGSALPLAPAVAEPTTTPLKPFSSKFFTGSVPDGWKVKDETANGIDLVSADQGEGVGFGWVQGPMSAPSVLVRQSVARYYPDAHVLWEGPLRGPGPGWVGYGIEFETAQAHGYWQSFRNQSVELGATMVAAKGRWEASKKTLATIAQSVQITPNAVSTVNAHIRAQMALVPRPAPPHTAASSSSSTGLGGWKSNSDARDRLNQDFTDSILDQERAVSPTTGEEYIVPTSAWNATGPQGAGYYRAVPGGSPELLQTPPAPEQ